MAAKWEMRVFGNWKRGLGGWLPLGIGEKRVVVIQEREAFSLERGFGGG